MIELVSLERANLLARQIATALDQPTHGMRIILVRPACLIHAVSRRLAWYGIPSRIALTTQPGMLRLEAGDASRSARTNLAWAA
ncbi:hypothetical protein [Niveispirillum sp. KHB5.9]|uniref:hypothetical protein n=1 Tax=Niveispirillum sp. KHB5.9 TaxID=3400269 RepID=UPI003A87222E